MLTRLTDQFGRLDQTTRLVCVEGWSMIAGWGGLRFADFLQAYPPMPGAKWASLTSSVNLDSDGNSDPYYVSIDLPTAQHPQTLLATHQNDPNLRMVPLTAEHGAPLRLVVPMKLGLKNIKAITGIEYLQGEPPDYWAERGYSKYDGPITPAAPAIRGQTQRQRLPIYEPLPLWNYYVPPLVGAGGHTPTPSSCSIGLIALM